MRRTIYRGLATALIAAAAWQCITIHCDIAQAAHGWNGKRKVSYQHQKDLFYNYYQGPYACNAAAQMYVAPLPVPANVGHTYVTYQPLMPHEFLYKHQRGYYTYNPAGGWTRTNVRYHSRMNFLQDFRWRLKFPQNSLQTEALNDFTFADRFGRYPR